MNKLLKYIIDSDYRFKVNDAHGFYRNMPDEQYLKRKFKVMLGYDLNLSSPKTYNEKLQWLKLYDRKPIYTTMVDKYEVKSYVASIIGDEYIIPNLGVWDSFEDIDFDSLPNRFVLKTTHDSGGVYVCKNKASISIDEIRRVIHKSLRTNFYYRFREWPYKNVIPRIIAEKYISDDDNAALSQQELTDYKFFCFNGTVDCVMVCFGRASGDTKYYFFGEDWSLKRINKRGKEAPNGFTLPKPKRFSEMLHIARELSKNIPFLRVDLYESNSKVYFGELTFYPQSGFDPNYLPETDLYFGSKINLSLVNREGEK